MSTEVFMSKWPTFVRMVWFAAMGAAVTRAALAYFMDHETDVAILWMVVALCGIVILPIGVVVNVHVVDTRCTGKGGDKS